MSSPPDLFEALSPRRPASELPDPDAIRARLLDLLQTARSAQAMPWNVTRTRVNEHLFHNMANWLPEPERETLRSAFAAELARLRSAP